ncbi:uncharacterized protein LOC111263875 [Varroa jacobsoni]|uniref:uncharacterized protein LOC111263875 n=1 Tax=Varroa jacobsoni TaxID=62625 RepID=UPI000BF5E7D8|nr:uncharacterized protein LOC111263875 [Varroa jacobsoni]
MYKHPGRPKRLNDVLLHISNSDLRVPKKRELERCDASYPNPNPSGFVDTDPMAFGCFQISAGNGRDTSRNYPSGREYGGEFRCADIVPTGIYPSPSACPYQAHTYVNKEKLCNGCLPYSHENCL